MADFKSGVAGGFGEDWKSIVKPIEGEDTPNAGEESNVYSGRGPQAQHTICPSPPASEGFRGGWFDRGGLRGGGETKAPFEEGLQGEGLQASHRQAVAGAVGGVPGLRMPYVSISVTLLAGLIIGAGVPIAVFYMAFKVGTWPFLVAATIISVFAIFWGTVLAILSFVPILDNVDEQLRVMNNQLNVYRAFIRSLLEELDEVNTVLRDIRDELRRVGGEA